MLLFVTFVYSVFFSVFFFFKQKTAYEMRISDWSSDVCSSDLYIYEPDAKSVIDDLLQRYVEGLLYQAVAENMASEQSARMVAKIGRASCRERVCQYV